jgi:hypothetical protein
VRIKRVMFVTCHTQTKTGTGDVGNSTSTAPADAGPYVVRQTTIRCIGS